MVEEVDKKRERTSEVDLICATESLKRKGERLEDSPMRLRGTGKAEETYEGSERQERQGEASSFTAADIDRLLVEAQESAAAIQGSCRAWRPESSQSATEFEQAAKKGSSLNRDDSQFLLAEVSRRVRSVFAEKGSFLRVSDLGGLVVDVLNILEYDSSCKPRSTAGKLDLFPIPVAALHHTDGQGSPFLHAVVASLNSLHSPGEVDSGRKPTAVAIEVTKRLKRELENSPILNEPLPDLCFSSFFSTKGLDYSGDEVRLALPICWDSVALSLPPEVGLLDIRNFCRGGVLHFVSNIDETIIPGELQFPTRSPSVMIKEGEWERVARGLVERKLCKVVAEEELYHIRGVPLLNGLFSVGKDEIKNDIAVSRLIMNLKPWNSISRSLNGDIGTLPSVTQMGALYLHDQDLVVTSSEDLRCFFYLFRVPEAWSKYMGFGRQIPPSMVPRGGQGKRWYLAGTVLPMGYLNSVGVAQHIHRAVVVQAMGSMRGLGQTIQEIRRDRSFTHCPNMFRVYLDNFDQLQIVDRKTAALIAGTPSEVVENLREHYALCMLPRHPKKSVEQSLSAEVQGAWLDGEEGTLSAKPAKIAKYIKLALEILERGFASQRELQVVGGGLVYVAMFKRPLLSSLNQIWRMIVEADDVSPFKRMKVRREVMVELVRFIGLCPLGKMNFRPPFDHMVTASDASLKGGGVCMSKGLTPYGHAASLCTVRGDIPEEHEFTQVLAIGLFDGIGALRVALDLLNAPVAGYVAAEKNPEARRVLEANFPDSLHIEDVELVTEEVVKGWAMKFSTVGLVLVGSGPPCQGVSGLNSDRKGALRDQRSCLFRHVPRILDLCRQQFPWAQVHSITENVASMDAKDCQTMSAEFDLKPWFIDAHEISLCHRPRLYWLSWELREHEGVEIYLGSNGKLPLLGQVRLFGKTEETAFLEKGWTKVASKALPTFTTSRPSPHPLRRPAGLRECDEATVERWRQDRHRFPPYQYLPYHCLTDNKGSLRTPTVREREVILGFAPNYTLQCLKKSLQGSQEHEDCRLSLLGNTWSVSVVTWLLGQLLHPLGLSDMYLVQDIVEALTPGRSTALQRLLQRPPLNFGNQTFSPSAKLTCRLAGLVSLKGEDLLLQGPSEAPVRHHRLRAGVPSKLWRWQTVSGWRWTGDAEHINVLEARAVLTTIKWRIVQHKQINVRCVHLVDSLVVLHALTRGRSSSRKMRRTIMRISACLLASGLQPIWAYVETKDNPADKPSRWGIKKKWLKR